MKKRFKQLVFLALLVFIIAGAGLRLIHIGGPSMWVDEANTVFSAESILENGLPLMPTGYIYGRAPLYTYSVALAYRILGVSLENARITSAIFGILCIPLIYIIATVLFGWRVGLISAFFMAFGFYGIGWSRVARMYTQFQFFTLLSLLCFLLGFERQIFPDSKYKKTTWNLLPFRFLKGVDIVALLLFVLTVIMTYFGVHRLSALTLSGLMAYVVIRMFEQAFHCSGQQRWLNKYSISSVILFFSSFCMFLIAPAFIQSLIRFIDYLPAWAKSGSSASDTWVLFKFLFSWQRFPLGLLFIWGIFQIFRQKHETGWIIVFLLLIPLFSLSFLFTHRHPKYLFSVYPFFYMLAAYGLISLLESKYTVFYRKFQIPVKTCRRSMVVIILTAFIVSPWLRIAKNIPWLEDGRTNGAVYFNEWKEAAHVLHQEKQPGDLIICSVPEALLYYHIKPDWALNDCNLALSSDKMIVNAQGFFMDVFAGRPLIDSQAKLTDLVDTHPRGWIVLTAYHFRQPHIISTDIQNFLRTRFQPPRWTKNRTVLIYFWDVASEMHHAF